MKARTFCTGLYGFIFCLRLLGAEDTKLPFTCTPDDLQWAGMTCSENEPCPIFLELSSVASVGSKIFLSGNIHSAETTLYSILLRSDDGGQIWREPAGRARGEVLDHIQFENFETGWVSGQRVIPLPGDPFLLITHDGGKDWQKVLVLPEGSPGIVQKFRFDSATTGKLIIDRGNSGDEDPQYRLLETKDGAETWTALESSTKEIKNAPVPVEDALWRVRADNGGKKLFLEHHASDKWVVAATFIIQIAECKGQ